MKPLKKIAPYLILLLALSSACKINQTKNKEKQGRWIYTDTVNGIPYKSTGKYKKGIEKGIWKSFTNNKLDKKEHYKHGLCEVTNYYENGTIKSKGQTKMVMTDSVTHWHYTGDWFFYDENGKLIGIRNYVNGELSSDKKTNGL